MTVGVREKNFRLASLSHTRWILGLRLLFGITIELVALQMQIASVCFVIAKDCGTSFDQGRFSQKVRNAAQEFLWLAKATDLFRTT